MSSGVSITDLTLNDFRIDLARFLKDNLARLESLPFGTFAVTTTHGEDDVAIPPGVIFCLRAVGPAAMNAAEPGYASGPYGEDEDEEAGSEIATRIDLPFGEFSRTFAQDQQLESTGDAKDFCKFLSAHNASGLPLVALGDRQVWHVERLREVIIQWRGPARHAGWLLVQTAIYGGVPDEARTRARQVVLELLASTTLNPYSRYRILHHLIKLRARRAGQPSRFILQLTDTQRRQIEALLPQFLAAPAFELNLMALYSLRVLGQTHDQLRALFTAHCHSGCQPVRNALEAMGQIPETTPSQPPEPEEPDASPEPY